MNILIFLRPHGQPLYPGGWGVGSGLKKLHVGRNLKCPNSYSNLIMWEITAVHNLCTNQYPYRGGRGGRGGVLVFAKKH